MLDAVSVTEEASELWTEVLGDIHLSTVSETDTSLRIGLKKLSLDAMESMFQELIVYYEQYRYVETEKTKLRALSPENLEAVSEAHSR